MISWESILSVFNTKGTLLKWLQKLEKALKDGVLLSVTVNTVSEGVITLTFNFADGSTITTPQIDIPQGAQGPQGEQGEQGPQGVPGPAGPDIFNDFTSLKIDTTDATVTYIDGVATITNARLIGYSSAGNEEVEIAVDIPIKAGENVTVDASEDDKSIQISATGGGGIEYAAELPTASETSPDFVQTPDGTLYRKKAVEGGSLLGTYSFNSSLNVDDTDATFNVSVTSNGQQFTSIRVYPEGRGVHIDFGSTSICAGGNSVYEEYQSFQITDISSLTNEAEFTSWLTANATQTSGGGASVTYSYVPQQDAIYNHNIEVRLSGQNIDTTGKTLSVYFMIQNNSAEEFIYSDIAAYLGAYAGKIVASANASGALSAFNNAEVSGLGFLLYQGETFALVGFIDLYDTSQSTHTVTGASVDISESTFTINVIDTVSKA